MVKFITILITLGVIISCNYSGDTMLHHYRKYPADSTNTIPIYNKDLGKIKKEGKLIAITTYSPTSYFLYKGRPMGFEYELLKRFANDLKLELELKIAHNIDSFFYYLNQGDADIIAHGITQTITRQKQVSFSIPLYTSHQVLVQKMPDNWYEMNWKEVNKQLIFDAIKLKGETISVRANTSYMDRLLHLQDEIGGLIHINVLPGVLTTEEIIKKVADGEIKYTVSDNNLAELLATYYSNLNVELSLSTSQNVSWAVRNNSPKLLAAMNKWLNNFQKKADYYIIYNKYYKNKRSFKKRSDSDFLSLNQNKISIYDDIVKHEALKIGWDWRLLCAQIYQESRFDPKATSWVGAKGLMQLMPSTADEFKVMDSADPQQNIAGGVKYLNYLLKRFSDIPDSIQKIKLTLAAYNCGYNHVKDAQRLAQNMSLNPLQWDDNIEQTIVQLSYPRYYSDTTIVKYGYLKGVEPFTYVNNIFEIYDMYQKFIK